LLTLITKGYYLGRSQSTVSPLIAFTVLHSGSRQ
jgi:hypothetical protein